MRPRKKTSTVGATPSPRSYPRASMATLTALVATKTASGARRHTSSGSVPRTESAMPSTPSGPASWPSVTSVIASAAADSAASTARSRRGARLAGGTPAISGAGVVAMVRRPYRRGARAAIARRRDLPRPPRGGSASLVRVEPAPGLLADRALGHERAQPLGHLDAERRADRGGGGEADVVEQRERAHRVAGAQRHARVDVRRLHAVLLGEADGVEQEREQ